MKQSDRTNPFPKIYILNLSFHPKIAQVLVPLYHQNKVLGVSELSWDLLDLT